MEYWSVFNVITNAKMYDVDIKGLGLFEAIEEINKEVERRKKKRPKK